MQEYSWTQILGLAGVYQGDNDMEADIKFTNWIKGRKYRIVSSDDYDQHYQQAYDDGIEILIKRN